MTVEVTTSRARYLTNGTTGPFTVSFYFLESSHLRVVYTNATGIEFPLALNIDYNVSGAGDEDGGFVTTVLAYASGGTITIVRDVPATQLTDYISQDAFPAESHEQALDKLTMIVQQQGEVSGRAIVYPVSDAIPGGTLPTAAVRAGKYLAFDAQGDPVGSGGTGPDASLRSDLAANTGAALVGWVQTGTGAVTRAVRDKLRDDLHVRDFGAVFNNSTDDTTALTTALTAAAQTVAGAQGNTLDIPQGTAIVSASVNIPNRVNIRGRNKRGSFIKAAPAHSGPYMMTAINGTSSMFDNALCDLTLDANNVSGLGCVISDAWQEGGGMREVLLYNFRSIGVLFQNGYGGAALCEISQSEIFGSATAAPTAGIKVSQISATGNFMLKVRESTIAGATFGTSLPRGIDIVKDSLYCDNVHFENCVSGIYLDGVGHHVLIGVSGGPGVTNVVEIAATFTGSVRMIGCHRSGATNILKDNRSGGYGTVSLLDADFRIDSVPIMGPGSVNSCGVFDGTGANPSIANCFGVASIVRNSTGNYTITESYARNSANAAVIASANNNGDIKVDLTSASTFQITTYASGGSPLNLSEIKFTCTRVS